MSIAHFRKLGRRTARLGLIAGLALSSITLAASAAQASPGPVPWNADYHNFGSASSAYAFVFTNLRAVPLAGVPAPIQHAEFQVTANTCKTPVAPGGSCHVRVSYAADGQPLADQLQMHFTGPGGRPVAVPPVQLFADGAAYVYTPHQNGAFVFPAAAAAHRRTAGPRTTHLALTGLLTIPYFANRVAAVDFPPPDLPAWLTLVRNTCTNPIGGSSDCTVTLRAAQNTGGLRTANFQMSFENAQTGASVPVQDVTLVQNAG